MRRLSPKGASLLILWAAAAIADASQRREAFPTFMGRPVYEWGADLKGDDAATRRIAAFALAKFGKLAAHYGPDLRALLEDPDPGVREAAALALGEFGSLAGAETIPALKRALLTDSNPVVRRSAASAL